MQFWHFLLRIALKFSNFIEYSLDSSQKHKILINICGWKQQMRRMKKIHPLEHEKHDEHRCNNVAFHENVLLTARTMRSGNPIHLITNSIKIVC